MINQLEIKNLSFKYTNDYILKNVSYNFKINEITVILGLNGSGKTTLLKLMCNFLPKYEGEVLINNELVKTMKPSQLSKYISFVPQLTNDSNDFLVKDFLTFGLVNSIKFYEQPKEKHLIYVEKIVNELELNYLLNKKMNELSGGEKQMIYICAAVIQNTPIIILDEPVSALDMNNQYKILTLLKKLRNDGKTVILTAHNPNICLYLESNVLIINNNKIYKNGYAKDIINIENLREVYGDNLIFSKESKYNEITFK